jgi:hypothetical protein
MVVHGIAPNGFGFGWRLHDSSRADPALNLEHSQAPNRRPH